MLDPAIAVMGSGSVPSTGGNFAAEAQMVLTPPVVPRPTPRDTYVAWPPKGFVPYQTVYPRWSFALANADFSAATVTMQRNGVGIPTTIRTRDSVYAGPTITWNPDTFTDSTPWPQPTADDVYTVTIANVGGVSPSSYTYNVTVFDPEVADPSHTQPVITGPASAPSGTNTPYSFNAGPQRHRVQVALDTIDPADRNRRRRSRPGQLRLRSPARHLQPGPKRQESHRQQRVPSHPVHLGRLRLPPADPDPEERHPGERQQSAPLQERHPSLQQPGGTCRSLHR